MATVRKERLRPLTGAERREVGTPDKASSERVDRVKRATALLAVAEGRSFSAADEAAAHRGAQPARVGPWRTIYGRHRRWVATGLWPRIVDALNETPASTSQVSLQYWRSPLKNGRAGLAACFRVVLLVDVG